MKKHVKVVHDKKQDHACTTCSYKAGSASLLKIHCKTMHNRQLHTESVDSKLEGNCNRKVCSKNILARKVKDSPKETETSEMSKDINAETLKYGCHHCGHKTKDMKDLLHHMKTTHDEKMKDYECPDCDFAASHCDSLERHVRKTHRKS